MGRSDLFLQYYKQLHVNNGNLDISIHQDCSRSAYSNKTRMRIEMRVTGIVRCHLGENKLVCSIVMMSLRTVPR